MQQYFRNRSDRAQNIFLVAIIYFSVALPLAAQSLLVSAAASLTNVLPLIASEFQKSHRGVDLKFNFAGSNTLRQQIELGAPADIFISASLQQMSMLKNKSMIDSSSQKNICGDDLVLIAPNESTLRDWNDLQNETVRHIAIGNPASVPAGMYAQQTLTSMQLWSTLQKKFLLCENVRQALAYVDGGNCDAGIVYRTDAMIAKHSRIVAVAPASSHEQIMYPAAVVARSPQRALAEHFVEFCASPIAQNIFQSNGFTSPK